MGGSADLFRSAWAHEKDGQHAKAQRLFDEALARQAALEACAEALRAIEPRLDVQFDGPGDSDDLATFVERCTALNEALDLARAALKQLAATEASS